jgi:hypothetical protein
MKIQSGSKPSKIAGPRLTLLHSKTTASRLVYQTRSNDQNIKHIPARFDGHSSQTQ